MDNKWIANCVEDILKATILKFTMSINKYKTMFTFVLRTE